MRVDACIGAHACVCACVSASPCACEHGCLYVCLYLRAYLRRQAGRQVHVHVCLYCCVRRSDMSGLSPAERGVCAGLVQRSASQAELDVHEFWKRMEASRQEDL